MEENKGNKNTEKLKQVKTIGIDTESFMKINTDLLLKRTKDKIVEKNFKDFKLNLPFNSRIRNLILSLMTLQGNYEKIKSK